MGIKKADFKTDRMKKAVIRFGRFGDFRTVPKPLFEVPHVS
jgi:hypothetical protein